MPAEPASNEIRVLEEKLRALQTLARYERDIQKLQIYKRDLDFVSAELQRIEAAQGKRPNAKVIPFPPENPSAPPEVPSASINFSPAPSCPR